METAVYKQCVKTLVDSLEFLEKSKRLDAMTKSRLDAARILLGREPSSPHQLVDEIGESWEKAAQAEVFSDNKEFLKPTVMKPTVAYAGLTACHNMPCAVYDDEPAVLNFNQGIFLPSWKAQKEGWLLIKAPRWVRRLLRRYRKG